MAWMPALILERLSDIVIFGRNYSCFYWEVEKIQTTGTDSFIVQKALHILSKLGNHSKLYLAQNQFEIKFDGSEKAWGFDRAWLWSSFLLSRRIFFFMYEMLASKNNKVSGH